MVTRQVGNIDYEVVSSDRRGAALDRLGMARFFRTLDLTRGYWQIPLSLESKGKNGLLHSVQLVPICDASIRVVQYAGHLPAALGLGFVSARGICCHLS